MRDSDLDFIIDRLYKVEDAYKGLTTRVRLLEADVDKLKMIVALDNVAKDLSKENL